MAPTTAGGPTPTTPSSLRQSSHGSSAHRTTITLSLDMRRAAKAIREAGRGIKGAAAVLRGQMEALEYSLRAADLHIDRWLDAAGLAVIVRQAYDPAASAAAGLARGDTWTVPARWRSRSTGATCATTRGSPQCCG